MRWRAPCNRLAACDMVDVEPDFVELNGSDPVAFILSANLARRHMTKGQRAMAAARAIPDDSVRELSSQYGRRGNQHAGSWGGTRLPQWLGNGVLISRP